MKGKDRKMYVVKKYKNGKRWVRVTSAASQTKSKNPRGFLDWFKKKKKTTSEVDTSDTTRSDVDESDKSLQPVAPLTDDYSVIAGGGYGHIVSESPESTIVLKLLKENACMEGEVEVDMQMHARKIAQELNLSICVPRVTMHHNEPMSFKGEMYKCSMEMSRVFPPPGLSELLHCCLSDQVSPGINRHVTYDGHSRGLFTGTVGLNEYLMKHGSATIKSAVDVARIMGEAYGAFVSSGLIPYDVEFVLGSATEGGQMQLFAIDFGLTQEMPEDGTYEDLLGSRHGFAGLETDLYIPQDSVTEGVTAEFKRAALTNPAINDHSKAMLERAFEKI